MEYRLLGRSGFNVPVLTFGTGTFGGKGDFFKAWGDTDAKGADAAGRYLPGCGPHHVRQRRCLFARARRKRFWAPPSRAAATRC